MNWFTNIFCKKISPSLTGEGRGGAPLSISGIPPAPMTPEPDDAELAAQAILETLASDSRVSSFLQSGVQTLCASGRADYKSKVSSKKKKTPETRNLNAEGVASDKRERSGKPETRNLKPETRDAKYYNDLASRIRQAHEVARQRTLRFVTFCEEQLQNKDLPDVGKGSLSLLEAELYKRIDTVEREGGDLKRRWQHCLAEVTVRRMGINQDE